MQSHSHYMHYLFCPFTCSKDYIFCIIKIGETSTRCYECEYCLLGHPTQLLGHLFLFLTWCFCNQCPFLSVLWPLIWTHLPWRLEQDMRRTDERDCGAARNTAQSLKVDRGSNVEIKLIYNFQNSFFPTKKIYFIIQKI